MVQLDLAGPDYWNLPHEIRRNVKKHRDQTEGVEEREASDFKFRPSTYYYILYERPKRTIEKT